jgi:hypothetical protein
MTWVIFLHRVALSSHEFCASFEREFATTDAGPAGRRFVRFNYRLGECGPEWAEVQASPATAGRSAT